VPIFGNDKPTLILRGIAGCLGLIGSFYTLQHIPLATAVTLNYLSPFLQPFLVYLLSSKSLDRYNVLIFCFPLLGWHCSKALISVSALGICSLAFQPLFLLDWRTIRLRKHGTKNIRWSSYFTSRW